MAENEETSLDGTFDYVQENIKNCSVCGDCEYAVYSEDYVNYIMKYDFDLSGQIALFEPDCVRVIASRYAVAYKKQSMGTESFRFGYNAIPKCYGLMQNTSIEATNVERIRRIPGLGMTGKDVIIGIVDTGIDYRNKLFRNNDGTTRISAIWDQTEPSAEGMLSGSGPSSGINMGYGTVYVKADIDSALQSDNPLEIVSETDDIGHGTFFASIAAGGLDIDNDFLGMAPECDIAVVKLKQAKKNLRDFYMINEAAICYQEDDIIEGIEFLLKVASILRKPIVILLGLGTSQGDHDGNSYLEEYIDRLSGFRGTAVVCSGGNELGSAGHYSSASVRTENIAGNISDADRVEIAVGRGERGFALEIWGQTPGIISVGITSPTGEIVQNIGANITSLNAGREINFLYEQTTVYIENILFEENSGDQLIFMRFTNPAEGIWTININRDMEVDTEYNIWLPIKQFLTSDTFFVRPEPNITLCSPANGHEILVAAGYNHRDNSIYPMSSRGFTRYGRRKPDVAAPSVNVYGAWKNNLYTTLSGTSVGAAHLAGAAALIFDWAITKGNYTNMFTGVMRQMIIRGAYRPSGEVYPNRSWGWGILDMAGIFEALRSNR